jgi:hypothetical protein
MSTKNPTGGRILRSRTALFKGMWTYALSTLICLMALEWYLDLGNARLDVPFSYTDSGDSHFSYMLVKSIFNNGWYLKNPSLGAPGILFIHDFPFSDHLHNLLIRLIAESAGNFGLTVNLYHIATFLLVTWTSLFALRRLGVSDWVAIGGSLIFAFLPYHFFRGQSHMYLEGYFIVPLTALMLIGLYEAQPILFQDQQGRWSPRLVRPRRTAALVTLTCLLTAWSGVYYAFFGSLLCVVAGLGALIGRRSIGGLMNALVAGALIGVFLGVGLIPNVLYWRENGKNPVVANRPIDDLPLLSLKLSSLLKPYPYHPLRGLKAIILRRQAAPRPDASLYLERARADLVTYLGMASVAGLTVLMGVLFLPRPPIGALRTLWPTSRLGLATILIGMPYGLGHLFGMLGSTKIRAYNRLSIYLAFFAILALSLVVDHVLRRLEGHRRWNRWARVGLALTFALCLFEQMPPALRPDHGTLRERFDADRDFYRTIEECLPVNAMVFQLPYVAFAEKTLTVSHSPHPFRSYRHFRGYLHTDGLRWSGGAMPGREADRWQAAVTSLPTRRMLDELRLKGFAGLTVDRDGYEDEGQSIEQEIVDLIGSKPIRSKSKDGRLLFFRISKDAADPSRAFPAE